MKFFRVRHLGSPCCSRHARNGFTLVEIALAVGIFAFAIVAIMALFPVGLRSANDSRVESIVTQIARTVMSDLRTPPLYRLVAPPPPAVTPPTNDPIMKGGKHMGTFQAALVAIKDPSSDKAENAFETIDLSANSTTYLLYAADGKIKAASNSGKYSIGDASGDFFVKIDSRLVVTAPPRLAQITVSVEAPAAAAVANRTKYPVVTLMGDTR